MLSINFRRLSANVCTGLCGCLRPGKQVVIALSHLLSLLTGREEKKMSHVLTGEGGGRGRGRPEQLVPLKGQTCLAGEKVKGGGGGGAAAAALNKSIKTKEA